MAFLLLVSGGFISDGLCEWRVERHVFFLKKSLLCAIWRFIDVFMLDDVSRAILRQLQNDPALTVPELAALTGLTGGKVQRRLDRLVEDGVLCGQVAVINWAALGFAVQVSLRVTLDKTQARAFDEFIAAARMVAEVIEIQTFLGRVDVRLSLVARDLPHYQQVYRDQILTLPHIADIEALMTVATVKSDQVLPL